jgi:thioredoxin reductase (NADPH)
MSQYLIDRIASQPNIDVVIGGEITELHGADGEIEAVTILDRNSGASKRAAVRFLFSFIGAEPNTDWLAKSGLALDSRGFVKTGNDAGEHRLPLETSRRGVFAIGDVRSQSIKRVAASVGDGALVVSSIHAYLADSKPVIELVQQPVTA